MKTCKCGFTTNVTTYKFCPQCANLLQERPRTETAQTYDALEISRYIINYINSHGSEVSNFKLQKILYYVQAAFLIEKGRPCFYNDIVNWQHGPVIPDVYFSFDSYGDKPIPQISTVRKLTYINGRFDYKDDLLNVDRISQEATVLIDKVLVSIMHYDAWFLAARTMEEEPWIELGTNYNSKISPARIADYFAQGENAARVFGTFCEEQPRYNTSVKVILELDEDIQNPTELAKVLIQKLSQPQLVDTKCIFYKL